MFLWLWIEIHSYINRNYRKNDILHRKSLHKVQWTSTPTSTVDKYFSFIFLVLSSILYSKHYLSQMMPKSFASSFIIYYMQSYSMKIKFSDDFFVLQIYR